MQLLKTLVATVAVVAASVSAQTNGTAQSNSASTAGNAGVVPYGSMRQVTIGPSYVVDLMNAMTNRTNYGANIGRPICIVEVKKVSLQMVSGINYQFQVDGCAQTFSDTLGQCRENGCIAPALWQIDVFVQPWNNTYQVQKIDFLK